MSTKHPFLIADEITKTYSHNGDTLLAADNISFSVDAGEVVSIVGSSGCGKSTLLKISAGLLQKTSGNISLNGISPEEYRQKNSIGFVFQKSLLFPWRTILQNIILPTEVSVRRPTLDNKRLTYLIKILGLDGFEDKYPRQLSGGLAQRATLARALLTKPKILFLDEPFSALDELTREQLWIDFSNIWRTESLAVCLVTHSIREAVFLSNKVIVLSPRPGRIRKVFDISFNKARTEKLFNEPDFVNTCALVRDSLNHE